MPPTSRPSLPPELAEGYARFRTTTWEPSHERLREVGEGPQRPATMVVACSDSRSGPETVFDAAPGELFVVRNVGALVPPYAPDTRNHATSAALEFAVLALGVRSIVVLGHGRCGAVAAAIDDWEPLSVTDFIGTWVGTLHDLADGVIADLGPGADPLAVRTELEQRSVRASVANLRTFPWIASREAGGALAVYGTWYDIVTGELRTLTATGAA